MSAAKMVIDALRECQDSAGRMRQALTDIANDREPDPRERARRVLIKIGRGWRSPNAD